MTLYFLHDTVRLRESGDTDCGHTVEIIRTVRSWDYTKKTRLYRILQIEL